MRSWIQNRSRGYKPNRCGRMNFADPLANLASPTPNNQTIARKRALQNAARERSSADFARLQLQWSTMPPKARAARRQVAEFITEISETDVRTFYDRIKEAIVTTEQNPFELSRCLGEALAQSWLSAPETEDQDDEKTREDLEFVITDLFRLAILLKNSYRLRFEAAVHALLIEGKKTEIDVLVFRCTLPILWRCLESPNDLVRMNASQVLFSFYPIMDEEPETIEEFLPKQHGFFKLLLGDHSVPIRLHATKAIFTVLKKFWKIIPADERLALFKIIVERNALDCDVSVREAVYEGLVKLLTEAQALASVKKTLKILIPRGIDDKHYKVRIAAFKLLTELKGHRFLKVFQLVDATHVLTRLDLEHHTEVKKLIVTLLAPQFRPKNQADRERARRIFTLVQLSSRAALIFHRYLFATGHVSLEEAVAHIKMIGSVIYVALKEKLSSLDLEEGVSISESLLNDTAATLSAAPDLPPLTPEDGQSEVFKQLKSLMDCAIVLLITIRKHLIQDAVQFTIANKFLVFFFKRMFVTYRSTVLSESIMILGSLLPEEDIGDIGTKVIRTLREVDGDETTDVTPYLAAAMSWKPEQLYDLIEASLATLTFVVRMQKQRGRGKQIKFTRAIEYLEHILANPAVKEDTFKNYAMTFEKFFNQLKAVNEIISARFEPQAEAGPETQVACEDVDLIRALKVRHTVGIKLICSLEDETDPEYVRIRKSVLSEVGKDFVWFVEITMPEDNNVFALYDKLSQEIFHLMSTHLQCYDPDLQYITKCINLVGGFVNAAPIDFIVTVLKSAKHLYRTVLTMEGTTDIILGWIFKQMDAIIVWIKECFKGEEAEEPEERMGRDIAAALVSLSVALYSPSFIPKMKATRIHVKTTYRTVFGEAGAPRRDAAWNDTQAEVSPFAEFYMKRVLPRLPAQIQSQFRSLMP
ncbi:hypothetical protein L596_017161 [Steinernema carpocapsae]|uniref:Uncharacterized protein n=1 Tax=Steinernema carpocapsae TaxID=34508 RepID=A0A4U5N1K9_STECR|nr:hypothetical protein L596_017161 [Steinernema carpocapsae]